MCICTYIHKTIYIVVCKCFVYLDIEENLRNKHTLTIKWQLVALLRQNYLVCVLYGFESSTSCGGNSATISWPPRSPLNAFCLRQRRLLSQLVVLWKREHAIIRTEIGCSKLQCINALPTHTFIHTYVHIKQSGIKVAQIVRSPDQRCGNFATLPRQQKLKQRDERCRAESNEC